ncbi:MAG: hypothetical protein [Olavius algarvensis Gamma 1 endosymbiont]|nr:MAG: hypothetical protein [Olavius algarvensis Gamma 1 endosymbiont]
MQITGSKKQSDEGAAVFAARARVGRIRGCLGTHFRNSLKIGRLDKINPLF